MRKLIGIAQLQVGMFVDAEAVTETRDGQPVYYLAATRAVSLGPRGRRARLTGRMHEKVAQDGGLLLTSAHQIDNLRETGLTMVTIDTDKGLDLPPDLRPLTDPSRRPPPPGRLVHFDEELERAQTIRDETSATLQTSLAEVVDGRALDVDRILVAGGVMAESLLRNVDAMVSLTRLKRHDPYTAVHCMNVSTLVTAVALHDGVDPGQIPMVAAAALLHDVGKTRVPLEVLNKPGRFEPHELAEMRLHAKHSGDIMRETGRFSDDAIAIATQHHEMLDGSGYPQQLRGEQIDRFARMTAVADVYDALTAKRVYKPAMPMYQALMRIQRNRGTEFDERVVDLFIKALGLYPVGTLLELNTRELALVFQPNPQDPHHPTVGVLTLPSQKPRAVPKLVDLAIRSEGEGREIGRPLDPEKLGIDVESSLQQIAERGEHGERRRREG